MSLRPCIGSGGVGVVPDGGPLVADVSSNQVGRIFGVGVLDAFSPQAMVHWGDHPRRDENRDVCYIPCFRGALSNRWRRFAADFCSVLFSAMASRGPTSENSDMENANKPASSWPLKQAEKKVVKTWLR